MDLFVIALGISFPLVLIFTLIALVKYKSRIREYKPSNGFSILDDEDRAVLVFGGEISPERYKNFIEKIKKKKNIKVQLIAGPVILLETEKFKKYIDPVTNKLRSINDIWFVHPVFEYMLANPGKLRVWIKRYKLDDEKHFAIALTTKVLYCEYNHDIKTAKGGKIFKNDQYMFEMKLSEFKKLRSNRDFCRELKLKKPPLIKVFNLEEQRDGLTTGELLDENSELIDNLAPSDPDVVKAMQFFDSSKLDDLEERYLKEALMQ